MLEECPVCGKLTLQKKHGTFKFESPGGMVIIEDSEWDECSTCKEVFIGHKLGKALEFEWYKRKQVDRPKIS
jgi:YgiT-type zinc finger domain-containing protein